MQNYEGLSTERAKEIAKQEGLNRLPQKKKSIFKKFFSWILSPVSLMLLAASLFSLLNKNNTDFFIILGLFFANFGISIWHEGKADKSIEKMQEHLTIRVKTLRDTKWIYINSVNLVPGDIVELKIGDIVPADITLLQSINLSVNESALTGESLPKEKKEGEIIYSGSFITKGRASGRVSAIGAKTNFGKTVYSVENSKKRSTLEKDIISISKFVSVISIAVVIILSIALLASHTEMGQILTLDLSLLIAGIPVALPTVMSLIISVGVIELAKRKAIVRRLASLEDLANVNLLLSDKTGTLTENKISVEKIIPFYSFTEKEILSFASNALSDIENDPLDRAVSEKALELKVENGKPINFIPADSERKRSTATFIFDGKEKTVSLGASQVILSLCKVEEKTKKDFTEAIARAAQEGYRVHALAIGENREEKDMQLAGIMFLSDKLRVDAKDTISFMHQNGIEVKMVTGDNIEIGKRVARALSIQGDVYERKKLEDKKWLEENFNNTAGFAEVLPKDKYDLVKFSEDKHIVAVTGDGVNDLPAIKTANVGFAVVNAVDALKSTADIVLAGNGISVIKDAIIEARKIFTRLYNYSLYRISESFRIIITIAVIGLIWKTYPLTPVQLIVLAFLNDIPIVSLAFDKVKISAKPAHINARKRFTLSTLFGLVGIANSLILLFVALGPFHFSWETVQTLFFLKLTVSGHMLIYVAHTKERWYKFLPSKQVVIATTLTQLLATLFAVLGIFTTKISIGLAILVWVWCFFWMQIAELMKIIEQKFIFKKAVQSHV